MSACVPACIAVIGSPFENPPSTIRTKATTPRYWSNSESKISARGGASGSPSGGGIRWTIASSTSVTPSPVFAEIRSASDGIAAEQVGHLRRDAVRVGPGQVDLVEDRDQLEAGVDRGVGVGDGLRLDALGGVDDEQRALAGREAARDLVGEVDVPGRVDQVQVVGLAVRRRVGDPHGLGLDRDPALALEVHRVEHLRHVGARVDGPGELEDAVGERRLAVVDVGDDREVPDPVHERTASIGSA